MLLCIKYLSLSIGEKDVVAVKTSKNIVQCPTTVYEAIMFVTNSKEKVKKKWNTELCLFSA